jgi:hypothetical protein
VLIRANPWLGFHSHFLATYATQMKHGYVTKNSTLAVGSWQCLSIRIVVEGLQAVAEFYRESCRPRGVNQSDPNEQAVNLEVI